MNICFLTRHDPYDKNSWSGIAFQMFNHLKLYHNVEWIGGKELNLFEKYFLKAYNKLFKYYKVGFWYYNYLHSKINTYHIQKKIKDKSFDLIFAPNSPDYIAFLETPIPIVYLHDATFQLFTNFYPLFFKLSRNRVKEGDKIEQNAIQKADRIIYSSTWAAQSAMEYYKAERNKISIIDFGANLFREPQKAELSVSSSDEDVCQLLFIGIDWDRKGGETVIETSIQLRKAGFAFKLTIVGCDPDLKEHADDVVVVPFLDKNISEEYLKLYKIYLKSHLLLLPTKADCTPIVFCEAAAFGIPVIASNVGGISSIILDGVNGYLLPGNANGIDYANKIISVFKDKKFYNNFRKSSRNEFEIRLNWQIWIEKVNQLLVKKNESVSK